MEVGKRYYFITHAYFHYLGEVVEILGKNSVRITNVIAVHSDPRGWTRFFQQGCNSDTKFDVLPDANITVLNSFDWNHTIPKVKS